MHDERDYVVEIITAFLSGRSDLAAWRAFTAAPLRDAELNRIRRSAQAVPLPLDGQGAETLRALLEQVEFVDGREPGRPAVWSMRTGIVAGLLAGALLWWMFHLSGAGLFYDIHLLLLPAVAGALIVAARNSRLKVGPHDPRVVAQNRRGRV